MPANDYREILLKILDAIGYADNKDDFINQFVGIIYSQSIIDLMHALPASDQEKMKLELSGSNENQEKAEEVIKKYFSEEQRKKAVEIAAKNEMVRFISTIKDTLSPSQVQNLLNLSQEFNSNI